MSVSDLRCARPLPGLLLSLLAMQVGQPVWAQHLPVNQPPTQVEIAARAAAAENAPLFASDEALVVTLEADLANIKAKRDKDVVRTGTFTFPGPEGQPMSVAVKLTTRGTSRRDKKICNFPPLKIDLPKGQVRGTVFDGQNKLKLVVPCNDRSAAYQRYALVEYLLYRTYSLLTPVSFRVRLLHITFKDTSGRDEDRTKYAFLIEDVDRLAERHFGAESERKRLHPYALQDRQAALLDLFQFMIGNTDWSTAYFHNIKAIRVRGLYFVIPYDFDHAGAVDAKYASPDRRLRIETVRERLYRGYCRDDVDFQNLFSFFNERKAEIYGMVEAFGVLDEDTRKRLIEYYDGFYDVINDDRTARRDILKACRRPH